MNKPNLKTDRTLTDINGRRLRYLRLSLTERCNLRCGYCYGSVDTPCNEPAGLTNPQIMRLVRAFAGLGFDKVRFTGGEVLLHGGIAELIEQTSATGGIAVVGITTNGLLLDKQLPRLIGAGLNRLNVSLDTLDSKRFQHITGVNGFERVFDAIQNAVKSRAFPRVKINTVIMRGVNDDEIGHLADWGLSNPIDLRFIEFMPTHRSGWGHARYVSEAEMKKTIGVPLEPVHDRAANRGPAITYRRGDSPGRISFISAVSRSFCGQCNRLRVTSQGQLVGCLFGDQRVDLRELVERNAPAKEIERVIVSAVRSPGFRREGLSTSVTSLKPRMRGLGG
ncbi:MAG: GTP 3',8-cyclase MoaA [Candidatus Latescibacterota bacterium]|nr:MAG: GTP 3',8-cyclase MoaA [Candidatus Latescibacterota bacterium]